VASVAIGGVANMWLTYWADHLIVFLDGVKPVRREGYCVIGGGVLMPVVGM